MQDRAGDVVRDVGDQVPWRRHEIPDRALEDVVVDEPQRRVGDGVGEAPAQVVDHPRIDLDGHDVGAGGQQGTGQDADAGPDLEDLACVRARACGVRDGRRRRVERGRRDDRLEHRGVGQEVLAEAPIRAQAVGGQVPAEGLGSEVARIERVDDARTGRRRRALVARSDISPRPAAATVRRPRSSPARSPARNRRLPAAPIMAALSVHRLGRGMISSAPSAAARSPSAARRAALAATPPPTMIERAEVRSAAIAVLVASTSTTDAWNAAASPPTSSSGMATPSSAVPPQASMRRRRTAVLRPLKLKSSVSPSQARGNGAGAPAMPSDGSRAPDSRGEPGLGRDLDRGTTRVRQPEHPSDLVEGLAGGVVDRAPEQPVVERATHLDEQGVAAADDEADGREGRWRARLATLEQPCRVEVALEVVDGHQRSVVQEGQRLGHRQADQERRRQTRAVGHRDGVDLGRAGQAGAIERLVEDGQHPAQVRPGRDLGHDAAGRSVERRLAGDDGGGDRSPALDDGDRGLVTARLDRQDAKVGRRRSRPRPTLSRRHRAPRVRWAAVRGRARRAVARVGPASPPRAAPRWS